MNKKISNMNILLCDYSLFFYMIFLLTPFFGLGMLDEVPEESTVQQSEEQQEKNIALNFIAKINKKAITQETLFFKVTNKKNTHIAFTKNLNKLYITIISVEEINNVTVNTVKINYPTELNDIVQHASIAIYNNNNQIYSLYIAIKNPAEFSSQKPAYTIYKANFKHLKDEELVLTELFTSNTPVTYMNVMMNDVSAKYLVTGSSYPSIKIYDLENNQLIKNIHNRFLLGCIKNNIIYAKKNNRPLTAIGRYIESGKQQAYDCTLYQLKIPFNLNNEKTIDLYKKQKIQLNINPQEYPLISQTDTMLSFLDKKNSSLYVITDQEHIKIFHVHTTEIIVPNNKEEIIYNTTTPYAVETLFKNDEFLQYVKSLITQTEYQEYKNSTNYTVEGKTKNKDFFAYIFSKSLNHFITDFHLKNAYMDKILDLYKQALLDKNIDIDSINLSDINNFTKISLYSTKDVLKHSFLYTDEVKALFEKDKFLQYVKSLISQTEYEEYKNSKDYIVNENTKNEYFFIYIFKKSLEHIIPEDYLRNSYAGHIFRAYRKKLSDKNINIYSIDLSDINNFTKIRFYSTKDVLKHSFLYANEISESSRARDKFYSPLPNFTLDLPENLYSVENIILLKMQRKVFLLNPEKDIKFNRIAHLEKIAENINSICMNNNTLYLITKQNIYSVDLTNWQATLDKLQKAEKTRREEEVAKLKAEKSILQEEHEKKETLENNRLQFLNAIINEIKSDQTISNLIAEFEKTVEFIVPTIDGIQQTGRLGWASTYIVIDNFVKPIISKEIKLIIDRMITKYDIIADDNQKNTINNLITEKFILSSTWLENMIITDIVGQIGYQNYIRRPNNLEIDSNINMNDYIKKNKYENIYKSVMERFKHLKNEFDQYNPDRNHDKINKVSMLSFYKALEEIKISIRPTSRKGNEIPIVEQTFFEYAKAIVIKNAKNIMNVTNKDIDIDKIKGKVFKL